MKNIKSSFFPFINLFILFLFACNSEPDDSLNIKNQVENHLINGTWRITKFIDSGNNETSYFTGYIFTFKNSDVLNASNGTNSYDGTWRISNNNNSYDDSNNLDFSIFFNLTNNFKDLNDDWDFISQSSSKIELIDVSGGNGGIDYLTFEKN